MLDLDFDVRFKSCVKIATWLRGDDRDFYVQPDAWLEDNVPKEKLRVAKFLLGDVFVSFYLAANIHFIGVYSYGHEKKLYKISIEEGLELAKWTCEQAFRENFQ